VSHKSTQRQVNITVRKEQRGWWERLTVQERKPVFLAPDFNRWLEESDAEMEIREKPTSCSNFRYPFYMLRCFNTKWKTLTWLRYTVWIPLYPLGVLAEVIQSIPIFVQTKLFSIPLPKAIGTSISFSHVLHAYLILMFWGKANNKTSITTVCSSSNVYFQY
ncbi:hypothetical protein XENOCAPTIV_024783, partial [Xenoophorus captivus]